MKYRIISNGKLHHVQKQMKHWLGPSWAWWATYCSGQYAKSGFHWAHSDSWHDFGSLEAAQQFVEELLRKEAPMKVVKEY